MNEQEIRQILGRIEFLTRAIDNATNLMDTMDEIKTDLSNERTMLRNKLIALKEGN